VITDERHDPNDSSVPAQREPDHDGQLYVGAAHPDSDLTPDKAAHHEPVPVDDAGEPVDRDPDDHEASTVHTADDETHRDEFAADDETHRDEFAADDTAHDDTAHDETAHDETARDEFFADDGTARDEPAPVEAAHGASDDDEHADRGEPPAVVVAPLGPPQVVAVPVKPTDQAEPAADLDHDEAAAEPATEPATETPSTELKPGDLPVAPVATFLADDVAQDLRQRWREAQLAFVDDPRKAADDVRGLVDEAIDVVMAALRSQRDEIGAVGGDDTEQFRVTVQRSRVFFDRLLSL
jgi:hypothetical protein